MRKFLALMLTTAPILIAGNAIAQQTTTITQGPMPTFETTPVEFFGDVGTKIKIKVENPHQPLQNGLSIYGLSAVGTDDKRAPFALCESSPTVGNVCECVYTVTQADTNRALINFGAIEDGEDLFEDFTTNPPITHVTEFNRTVSKTIHYNSSEAGWTGSGLNDCSMLGWSFTNGTGGFVESDPLMPSTVEVIPPGFTFDIPNGEVPDGTFWIDPPVAVGYTYSITGAEFVSVTMPNFQTVANPHDYKLTYGTHTEYLAPGDTHSFVPSSVSTFEITDINPPAPLDPNDETAFPIGIDLTDPSSDVQIKQVAILGGPSVAPTASKSTIYPPASVNLTANAVDATGGSLQFNWSGPNLSNANIENPTATFTSTVATPTTQTYSITATNSSGAASSTESVEITLLPKHCVGFNGANLFNLLPVYTASLNGNYTVKAKISDLTSHLSSRLTSLKSVDQDFKAIAYTFDITNQNLLPVSSVGKISGTHDGATLTLFSPGMPVTEFWNGTPLAVGQWYNLNLGMNTDPVDAVDLSCHTKSVKFRLPQVPYSPGRPRFATKRPMEIQDASGGAITTIMVPIHAKKAKAVLTDGLGIKTVGGGGNVVVGDIVTNGGGRLSDITDISSDGVKVIDRRGFTGVKTPKPIEKPAETEKTEPDSEDAKKEDVKLKRFPWRR